MVPHYESQKGEILSLLWLSPCLRVSVVHPSLSPTFETHTPQNLSFPSALDQSLAIRNDVRSALSVTGPRVGASDNR